MPKKNQASILSRIAQMSGDPESVIKDRAKFQRIARLMVGGDVTGFEREMGTEIGDDDFKNLASELHTSISKKNPKIALVSPYRMVTEEDDGTSDIQFAPVTRIKPIDDILNKMKPMEKRTGPHDTNEQ